ncbi:uncharacterized protein BDZ99DRAFT_285545 [Mytilinidion resinicola]|uniref:Uncharacterized protein n=1 Tax=Mytilinidion resinicola TaxID=574789 RepID=A0A6A6YPA3_9PEZI|nr:uncharacterized protein BDZ99DRAFT_285545 [Mytilinidion resinicola]KAF2810581.1 hypothetical protein BDZ99DRAFT_285545 [Mytilinidion resinicola]
MADRGRPFQEVSVRSIVGQNGSERFEYDDKPERVSDWRVNLTALSKVHNLYFLACSEEIHVHRPTFPEQRLSSKPLLKLGLPVTRPGLRGYLDPHHPHSANRILLDFLGHEEALLVACDDGDVIGFFVKDILKHEPHDTTVPNDICLVRPFFHTNVAKSAWGLAIHSEARLIAVSANTRKVSVFVLALSPSAESLALDPARSYERKLESADMGDNIPAVHFNNTGSDPKGQWILCSTIAGQVFVWDTHRTPFYAERLSLGFCFGVLHEPTQPAQCTCFDQHGYPHALWNSVFLDPRSFKKTHLIEVTLGTSKVSKSHWFWDISASKLNIPGGQKLLSSPSPRTPAPASATVAVDNNTGVTFNLDSQWMHDDDSLEEEEEIVASDAATGQPRRRFYMQHLISDGGRTSSSNSHCPVLIVAKKDLFLVQPLTSEATSPPVIVLHNPLAQTQSQFPKSRDRMCFFEQIPELGVVIVASSIGRAAVITLTQYNELDDKELPQPVYGFRLDHLLPFPEQEKDGWRRGWMLGIAVSPLQGMLGTEGVRRWRLILYYADHTVLAYEIGKIREPRNRGVEALVI